MPYREPIRAHKERPPSPPHRNISQSSSHTTSSTSSLEAVPIRPQSGYARTPVGSSQDLPSVAAAVATEGYDQDGVGSEDAGGGRRFRNSSQSPITPRPDRHHFNQRDAPSSPRFQQYHHPAPAHLLPLELRPSASGPDLASLRQQRHESPNHTQHHHTNHDHPINSPPRSSSDAGMENLMDSMVITPTKNRGRSCSANTTTGGRPSSGESSATTIGPGHHPSNSNGGVVGSTRSDVRKAVSLQDFTFGEIIGQGSYSTVVLARQNATNIPYAIKILDQAHLVQQKKTKYAKIERDALVRLGPHTRSNGNRGSTLSMQSNTTVGHRRRGSNQSVASSVGAMATGVSAIPINGTQMDSGRVRSARNSDSYHDGSWNGRRSLMYQGMSMNGNQPPNTHSKSTAAGLDEHGASSATSPTPTIDLSSSPTIPMTSNRPASTHVGSPPLHGTSFDERGYHKPDLSRLTIPTSPQSGTFSLTPYTQQQPHHQQHASSSPTATSTGELTIIPSRTSTEYTADPSRLVGRRRKRASHPGVIKLNYTFKDHTSLYFVLDLAINGDLLGMVQKWGSLDLESARRYGAQLVDTVDFMHERGVIHRDLKPENVLLDDDWRIKVTDFGSAKLVDPVTLEPSEPGEGEGKKRSFVGTAEYVSPEVLRNEHAGPACDIWAYGCILFQLIAGRPPFRAATEYLTFQKVLACDYEFPEEFDPTARKLVERILKLDPADRPSLDSIRRDPFFASIDFNSMWTDQMADVKTGIRPPVERSDSQEISFTEAFGTAHSDDEEASDGIHTASEQEAEDDFLRKATKAELVAAGTNKVTSPTPQVGFPTTRERKVSDEHLRSPHRNWIKASADHFSSTDTLESAADKAKTLSAASGGGVYERTESPLARKRTHQWEHDDRKRLWAQHLGPEETIAYQSPILTRAGIFLPKRRTLVLTSLPRLLCVKEDASKNKIKVEGECIFASALEVCEEREEAGKEGLLKQKVVTNVLAKGPRAFQVQTTEKDYTFIADREDVRARWLQELKAVSNKT